MNEKNNTKGTIFYIGGFELPDKNAAAHRVLNNSKAFKLLGYNVVFCGVDRNIKNNAIKPIDVVGFNNYPMPYPSNTRQWINQLLSFSHIARLLNSCADLRLVIAYNMHAQPLKKLLKYCKKNNLKIIADVTEWYENKFSLHPIKFIKWLDTKTVMTKYLKKVNGMISISAYLTNYYKPFINHIIEMPPLVDTEEKCWHQKTISKNHIIFTYAGTPDKSKDKIGPIVRAFALVNSDFTFEFNVIGMDRKQFLQEYPDLVNELNFLGNKISFCGRVSHDESIKALLYSDYCIFVREKTRKNMAGFPTKFAECVTANIGIIANDVSNIKDYFPIKNSFLLQNLGIEAIRIGIELALTNGKVKNRNLDDFFDYRKHISAFDVFLGELYE